VRFDPAGGLWVDGGRTLLVADLHLGYAWAQRRRGELGPVVEGGARERLLGLVEAGRPERVVLVGDIVHAPRPAAEERRMIEETLRELRERAELICVLGNHDRAFAAEFAEFPAVGEWRTAGVRVVHGDVLPTGPEEAVVTVVGHFHPVVRVKTASGASQRLTAFLEGRGLVVLPAFSGFSMGCDMRREMPAELRQWFGAEAVRAVVTDGERLLEMKIGRPKGRRGPELPPWVRARRG
jgi:putative SbcD/Mre11-related phosphoesterase